MPQLLAMSGIKELIWARAEEVFNGKTFVSVGLDESRYPISALADMSQRYIDLEAPEIRTTRAWSEEFGNPKLFTERGYTDMPRDPRIVVRHLYAVENVGGYPVFGGRKQRHMGWESKIGLPERLKPIGVPHAPWEVVRNNVDELMAAHARLTGKESLPTVWAVDGDELTINGLGTYLVASTDDALQVVHGIDEVNNFVRISRFVFGKNCSLHVLIADQGIHILPSSEEIPGLTTKGDTKRFFGPGALLNLVPQTPAMTNTALRIGKVMQSEGVRGAVTIDGVLSDGVFYVGEVNSRPGSSIFRMTEHTGIPLNLAHLLVAGGTADGLPLDAIGPELAAAFGSSRPFGIDIIFRESREPFEEMITGSDDAYVLNAIYNGKTLEIRGNAPNGQVSGIELMDVLIDMCKRHGLSNKLVSLRDGLNSPDLGVSM